MKDHITVAFEGIDYWNRPVFREKDTDRRYGSVEKLCTSMDDVSRITADDLLYFGRSFDCEPMGDIPYLPIVIESA